MTAKKISALFLLLVLPSVLFLLRKNQISIPLISDEGEYAYEARLLTQGGLPYQDAYNQKPPLVFFLYRLAYGFSQNPLAPRVLDFIFACLTMVFLFLLTPETWSLASRLASPAVFAVISSTPLADLFSANCEMFLVLFNAASIWTLVKFWKSPRHLFWAFLSGLFCGLAFMTKQTVFWFILGLIPFFIWTYQRPKALKQTGLFGAGVLLPPLAFVFYFWIRGDLRPFMAEAFLNNGRYIGIISHLGMGAIFQHVVLWWGGWYGKKVILPDWPIWGLCFYALSVLQINEENRFGVLATLWLGTSFMGAMTGLFLFPHYFFTVYPPLSILAAQGVQCLKEKYQLSSRSLGFLILTACLYPIFIQSRAYFEESPLELSKTLLYPNPLFESKLIAQEIQEQTSPEEKIYVFGSEPEIYIYSERKAATPYITSYPLTLFPKDKAQISEELSRLQNAPPSSIVYCDIAGSQVIGSNLGIYFRDEIQNFLKTRYSLVGKVPVLPNDAPPQFISETNFPLFDDSNTLYLFRLKE